MTKSPGLMERIIALPRNLDGEHAPPAELVAFCVITSRNLRNWKQSTLADLSGVSLSTVERVERGETVRHAQLDSIAAGLGFEPGYFTRPRRQLSPEAAADAVIDTWGHLVPVAVGPIRSQAAIRGLVRGHGLLLHTPDCPDGVLPAVQGLAEWIDFGSCLFSDLPLFPGETAGRRREYYGEVLQAVRKIEAQGCTVLGGTVTDDRSAFPDLRITLLSVTPRSTDPGAARRKLILADRRNWAMPLEGDWVA